MSTRYSGPAPAPVGERSTDGNRISQSARREKIPARNRANRKVIPRSVPWYEVNAYPEGDIMPDFTMGLIK